MTENKFNRIEMYDMGLYGIWTEGYRRNDPSLCDLFEIAHRENNSFMMLTPQQLFLFEINYPPALDKRIQEISMVLVDINQRETQEELEKIIKKMGLSERNSPLDEEELQKAKITLDVACNLYRKYHVG